MKNQKIVIKQLVELLEGKGAHADFEEVVKKVPHKSQGNVVEGVPHSLWQELEHIRLTQKDILNYMTDPNYQAPEWPKDYWPEDPNPPTKDSWSKSMEEYSSDLKNIIKILKNPKSDLSDQIEHGEKGHTLFREILLIADHTSYHLGQMVLIRRLLGLWKSS